MGYVLSLVVGYGIRACRGNVVGGKLSRLVVRQKSFAHALRYCTKAYKDKNVRVIWNSRFTTFDFGKGFYSGRFYT